MNPKQLRYIQVLAQEKSFSRAADELGISQPSLSQYIRKAEQEAGQKLFYRNGGGIRLTQAGEICLELGGKILELERQLEERMDDLKQRRRGVLTIGAAPFRTASLLPRVIAEFRKYYPGFTVRIAELTTAQLLEGSGKGEFDFCLCTEIPEDGRFVSETIADERLTLAVPVSYEINEELKQYGENAVPFAAVAGLPFVSVGETQALGVLLAETACAAGIGEPLQKSAVCINVESCLAMVRAGVGAALLPEYLVKGDPSVCTYCLKERRECRKIVVFYPRDAYLGKPARTMIDLFKSVCGGITE